MNIIQSPTAMAAKPPAQRTSATTEVPKPPASESSGPIIGYSFAVALVLGILFLTVRFVFHGIRKRVEAIESWCQQTHESLQTLTKQNAATSQNIANLGEQLRSQARKLKETDLALLVIYLKHLYSVMPAGDDSDVARKTRNLLKKLIPKTEYDDFMRELMQDRDGKPLSRRRRGAQESDPFGDHGRTHK